MKKIGIRALMLRARAREQLLHAHPALRPRILPAIDVDAIVLGRSADRCPVCLGVRARLEHMHIVGTTGGGKTRLIQHCACQDIAAGRGVCIVDPHGNHPGSLYRSMLAWLANSAFREKRIVHLIDPNAATHVTGFNPLALPSPEYDSAVIAEAVQQALERVWGEEDMNTKPTMQRVLSAILTTLAELGLTLADANLLLDPEDRHGVRAWAMRTLVDEDARNELEWLQGIATDPRGHQDFRQEVTGPRNRLSKLTRNEHVKLIVSQNVDGIDFRTALDEGHVILANLSPGPLAGDNAVQMLGRLLTRSIFFHTVRRRRPDRPFFLYLDECQRYLSGDISQMLAEARKYGTGVVLAHQTLAQLRAAGDDVLDAIKSTTNIKIVTRIKDPAEAAELADMVVRHNLEMPVSKLTKPTVVGYQIRRMNSESESASKALARSQAKTVGDSITESAVHTHTEGLTESEVEGSSDTETWGTSEGNSSSATETDASGDATTVNLSAANILALPPTATGNTLGESTGTFSDMRIGTPTRYIVGNARREPAAVSGVAIGQNRQRARGTSSTMQSGTNHGTARAVTRQRGRAHNVSDSFAEGIAYTASQSTTNGLTTTDTNGTQRGWSESLEPILEDRPTAVHSLENVRYMAGEVLRNFAAGLAAISFVDGGGLKTAMLNTARVLDCKLSEEQFASLRHTFLEQSPSAVPIEAAKAALQARQTRVLQRASEARDTEASAPQQFRTKRKRDPKSSVDAHDEPSAPKPPPVKGPDRRRRRP